MYGKGALLRAIIDGLYAQRKLNGDPDIIAKDDPEFLQAVIAQGKRAEEMCRREGWTATIAHAHTQGGVPLKEDGKDA